MPVLFTMFAASTLLALYAVLRLASKAEGTALLVVSLVVAVPTGFVIYTHTSNETRLAAAVSELVGEEAAVTCPLSFFGEFNYTRGEAHVLFDAEGQNDGVARLDTWVCAELASWPRNENTERARVAVHILTHEGGHILGVMNEASTECWAVRHNHQMASLLGSHEEAARDLGTWYYTTIYPDMPDGYRDQVRCQPGGEWDISSGTFPTAVQE